jgi:hypothetical protein
VISVYKTTDDNDTAQDDKKDDSIGSAGSLAQRSERSNRKMSEMWEDDDELSGDE